MSAFFGLHIARRALMAQQRAMEVTGHNIANANTPGFSRQQALMATAAPFPYPAANAPAGGAWQLGSGVEITAIRRVRDSFLDYQFRSAIHSLGYWEANREVLSQVEMTFLEPSENGLANLLSEFWGAWQELSKNPESMPVRVSLREKARSLTDTVRLMYRNIEDLRQGVALDIETKVAEVNALAGQLVDLNQQIVRVTALGQHPNDLLDQRDLLLDRLSRRLSIALAYKPNGAVEVHAGNRILVQEAQAFTLRAEIGTVTASINWEKNGQPALIRDGDLQALLDAYNTLLPGYQEGLNELVRELVDEINSIHRGGFGLNNATGINFFQPIAAGDVPEALFFRLSDQVLADVNNIASARNVSQPGDGGVALDIARLRAGLTMQGGTVTFESYYQNLIARMGTAGEEAGRLVNLQGQLVKALEIRREEAAGVSLDEEMLNLVQFQHAYQAAARFASQMDEMLDVLINRTFR
jgi:flagellar hook-associated protein 1 FlgK